jgi:hypothetical protein
MSKAEFFMPGAYPLESGRGELDLGRKKRRGRQQVATPFLVKVEGSSLSNERGKRDPAVATTVSAID